MEGFLWLLLQMVLLLTAAAVVFFVLGWRWRGQNVDRRLREISQSTERAELDAVEAEMQRDSSRALEEKLRLTLNQTQSELQEAHDRQTQLQREVLRLADELKAARQTAEQTLQQKTTFETRVAELTDAAEQERVAHQIEKEQAEQELNRLRLEVEQLRQQPEPVFKLEAPTPKPKRSRTAATATKTPAKSKGTADATTKLSELENHLQEQQRLLATLTSERDHWQREVNELRDQGADSPGLAQASKSLTRSSENAEKAQLSLTRTQRQITALTQALEKSASLSEVDDLTQIKGIKTVLRDQLYAYGIRTFRQIAEWSAEDVEAFSDLLAFKNRAQRDAWVQQASELLQKKA